MKRILLCAIIFASIHVQTHVQAQDKKFWIDAEMQQNFMLNNWFDNDNLNGFMQKGNTFEVRGRANWNLYKKIGVYADMTFCVLKDDIKHKVNLFNEFDLNNYYVKDNNLWRQDADLGVRFSFGTFYKFTHNKWRIIPYLGIGIEDFDIPSVSYSLKEKGSNNVHRVYYQWFPGEDETYKLMSSLSLQIQSSYKVAKYASITFGVSYQLYLSKPNFTATVSEEYGESSETKFIDVTGNNAQKLGLSVGVAFR